MEQDKIVNAIINLPPEAQRQIADFIDFLQIRYKADHKDCKAESMRFADEPFIGMWKNKHKDGGNKDGGNRVQNENKKWGHSRPRKISEKKR
jgi:hypothetical protein